MDQQLLDAIDRLTKTIESLSSSLGRGTTAGSTGGVNQGGGGARATQKAGRDFQRFEQFLSGTTKKIADTLSGPFKRNLENSAAALKKHADVVEDAAEQEKKAAKERAEATKDLMRGMGRFGTSLLTGSGDFKSAVDGLASSTSWAARSGNKFAGFLNTFAIALGFTLGQVQKFAEAAQSAAGMVDLSVLRVGSITLAKNFSSLGDSYVKMINASAGSFRVFGGTTKEALENLSQLSRGLRLGSSAVRSSMGKTLGKDVVKDFDRASEATAALGLTQEEQATLQASIMQSVRWAAKNEVEAQKMLVKQYADTTESARKLGNALGTSAKDILEVMKRFNQSTSGQLAAMKGVKGAQEISALLLEGLDISEEKAQEIALDYAAGRGQAALSSLAPEQQALGQIYLRATEQARQMEGGLTQENLTKAFKSLAPEMLAQARMTTGEAGAGQAGSMPISLLGSHVKAGFKGETFATRLMESTEEREKREKQAAKDAGKTEAQNVKDMSKLTAALDSLRGSVNALTTAILSLGTTMLFAMALATTGIGKAVGGAVLRSLGGAAAGAAGTAAAGAGGAVLRSLGGAAAGAAGTAAAGAGAAGAAAGIGGMASGALKTAGGFLKSPLGLGSLGYLAGELGASVLGRDTKAGAASSVLGTAAGMAGTGAMLGSFIPGIGTAIGAGVGGLLGLGTGLWSNASTLFGGKTADVTPDAASEEPAAAKSKTKQSDDMSQIMSYLSSISNDISAIRSNTRGDNASVPVRLG